MGKVYKMKRKLNILIICLGNNGQMRKGSQKKASKTHKYSKIRGNNKLYLVKFKPKLFFYLSIFSFEIE